VERIITAGTAMMDLLFQFAVIEAYFGGDKAYVAPTSAKWLTNIRTAVDAKGNILKCTSYWPTNDDNVYRLLMKHVEPDPEDTQTWLPADDNVVVFRFCRKRNSFI